MTLCERFPKFDGSCGDSAAPGPSGADEAPHVGILPFRHGQVTRFLAAQSTVLVLARGGSVQHQRNNAVLPHSKGVGCGDNGPGNGIAESSTDYGEVRRTQDAPAETLRAVRAEKVRPAAVPYQTWGQRAFRVDGADAVRAELSRSIVSFRPPVLAAVASVGAERH